MTELNVLGQLAHSIKKIFLIECLHLKNKKVHT